jgi:serine/threonine protein kinase
LFIYLFLIIYIITGIKDSKEEFLKSLGGVMESSAAAQQNQKLLNEESTLRLEMTRTMMVEQEKERTIMAKEDIAVRQFEIDTETLRAAPYLLLQIEKAREFSRLLQLIVEPPIILSRLIFLMGFDFEGGLRVMCQDPANYRMLDVIALPIQYPEDEENLCQELIKLIGKGHRNLVKVVDFSIHQVRGFTFTGYKAVNERSAIIVMEKYDGPNVMEYLQENWEETKNDDFRTMLLQIVNGIRGCHEESIVHRNFHEDSVVVELPPGSRVVAGGIASVAGAPVGPVQKWGAFKFNCRLGEYWITQNPRRAGCQYSMGRSDWGIRCRPPETFGGFKVSEASDMYAFGICVYQWATGGRNLPNMTTMHVDNLQAHIPLKWGTWVFSLLRMCLQQNPKHRAKSIEVHRFLSNRKICMGLRNTHY